MSRLGQPATDGGRAVDALLPALTLVLGLQAWRAAVATLAQLPPRDDGYTLVGAAALFAPVLLAQVLAARRGALRVAGALALLLAALRLLAALCGPAAAPFYGLAGTATLAAYLTLWPGAATSRRQAGHALALGFTLHLCDRLVSGTFDYLWQAGWWPVTVSVALTLPALWLALTAVRGPAGLARRSPLAFAMPFVLMPLATALAHPTRAAASMAWSLPRVFWLLAASSLAGVAAAGFSDQLLQAAFTRRLKPRALRLIYHLWRSSLTAAVVLGLLSNEPRGLVAALLAGPAALLINVGVLQRARPIGRPQALGGLLPLGAWWLASALTAYTRTELWPAALAVLILYLLAGVALYHQERPDPAVETVAWWLLPVHALLVVLAAVPLLWPAGRPLSHGTGQPRQFTVAVVDGGVSREQASAQWRSFEERPQWVLLVGLPESDGYTFDDRAYWLSRKLGLVLKRHADGGLAILSAERPSLAHALGDDALMAVWRYDDDNALAAAVVDDPSGAGDTPLAAADRVLQFPRPLLGGRVVGQWQPPAGLVDLLDGQGHGLLLLGGGGVSSVSVATGAPGAASARIQLDP